MDFSPQSCNILQWAPRASAKVYYIFTRIGGLLCPCYSLMCFWPNSRELEPVQWICVDQRLFSIFKSGLSVGPVTQSPHPPHLPPQILKRRSSTAPQKHPWLTAMPLPTPSIPPGVVPSIPVYGGLTKELRPPGPSTLPALQSLVFALYPLESFLWAFSLLLSSGQNLGAWGHCLFCSPIQQGPPGSGGERTLHFTPCHYFQTFSLSLPKAVWLGDPSHQTALTTRTHSYSRPPVPPHSLVILAVGLWPLLPTHPSLHSWWFQYIHRYSFWHCLFSSLNFCLWIVLSSTTGSCYPTLYTFAHYFVSVNNVTFFLIVVSCAFLSDHHHILSWQFPWIPLLHQSFNPLKAPDSLIRPLNHCFSPSHFLFSPVSTAWIQWIMGIIRL